jgi:peptidoglycan hydrolase-like protein with peptidoglycan-binding domain
MYTAKKLANGNYQIFQDGVLYSTGTESTLANFGLSPTKLTSGGDSSQSNNNQNQYTPPVETTPTIISAPTFPQSNLQPGQNGEEVKSLQKWLIQNGYPIISGPTGYYGKETKDAVTLLQKKLGINAGSDAGFFGPKTISALASGSDAKAGDVSSVGSTSVSPTGNGYYNVNGAYFQKQGDVVTPVSDPATINGLRSGSIQANQTEFSALFGNTIATTVTPDEQAFFSSADFTGLPKDQQDAIRAIFNTVQTNDSQKKDLLQKAIEKATENADPIFKQTLRLSLDALDRGFTDADNDLQYNERKLTDQLARLREDTKYNKNDLTIEQQNELKQLEDSYAQQLGDTRQNLAASGFTDSSRRIKSEDILNKTKGNLVESSNRKFADQIRTLDNGLSRGEADTTTEIQRLRDLTAGKKTTLGRTTEEKVGSANLNKSGYDELGDITGTADRTRQKDIDTASADYYKLGFVA